MVLTTIRDIIVTLLALSGWGKVLIDWISGRPKIRGLIMGVIKSTGPTPGLIPGLPSDKAWFMVYAYLVNQRKNAIHILDYHLDIKTGRKWHAGARLYALHTLLNFGFLDVAGKEVPVDQFQDNLIYRKNAPVEFGRPLHGWIPFLADRDLYQAKDVTYRLTCIDAFQRKHRFKTHQRDLPNMGLWAEMAGIRLPKPPEPR